jgi:multiple sugar transport system substrate-binding protein
VTEQIEGTIDRNSRIPLYKQVKDYLLELIKKQRHEQTHRLPPEVEISKSFNISRATVRIAILDLVKDGILERVPGKGTYIRNQKKSLIFTSWLNLEQPYGDSLNHMVEQFNAQNPNANIETLGIPYEKTEYQLMAMALGGKAPDVATLVHFWIPIFAHHGALYPLDELYTDAVRGNLFPQSLYSVRYKNRYYGFNWINAPNILYHNRKVTTELTGYDRDIPAYYEELCDLFRTIHNKTNGKVVPFALPIHDDEIFFLSTVYNFLLSFKGGLLDEAGNIIFSSEANIKAYTWLKKFIREGHVDTSTGFRENRIMFANNRLAFFIDGPWLRRMVPTLYGVDPTSSEHIGYSTLPGTVHGKSWSVLWNHTLAIFRQCQNKQLAQEFIRFLALEKRNAEHYYETSGMLPVMVDEVTKNPVYDDAFGRVLKKQMKNAYPIPSSHPSFLISITFCAKASREILLGDSDIKSTLNHYTELIRQLYKR